MTKQLILPLATSGNCQKKYIDPENKGVSKFDPENKGLSRLDPENKGLSSESLLKRKAQPWLHPPSLKLLLTSILSILRKSQTPGERLWFVEVRSREG